MIAAIISLAAPVLAWLGWVALLASIVLMLAGQVMSVRVPIWLPAALLAVLGVAFVVQRADVVRLHEKLAAADLNVEARAQERDKARSERNAALDAADACSRSVAALQSEADRRHKAATPARQQAAQRAALAADRANVILATPAAVPGDDAASARQRAWQWLEKRGRS